MISIQTIQHDIKLDFSSSYVKKTIIKQGSINTHVLNIQLYANNKLLTIEDSWEVSISTVKSDGRYVLSDDNITISDNIISVTVTTQMVSCSGDEKCEIIIIDGDQTLYTSTFLLYIEPNVNDGNAIESSDDYKSIADVLEEVREMEQEIQAVVDKYIEIETVTEPTDQTVGSFWLQKY